jgi:hypothetical protein
MQMLLETEGLSALFRSKPRNKPEIAKNAILYITEIYNSSMNRKGLNCHRRQIYMTVTIEMATKA